MGRKSKNRETWETPLSLVPLKFDKESGRWREQTPEETQSSSPPREHLNIVTYNVLMDDCILPELCPYEYRWPAGFRILEEQDADVICLVEVSRLYMSHLLALPWVRDNYYVTDVLDLAQPDGPASAGPDPLDPYGQVILSRLPFAQCTVNRFTLYRGNKKVVLGVLNVGGQRVAVGCLHLAAMAKHITLRSRQMDAIYAIMQDAGDHLILAGDFNFNDNQEDNEQETNIEKHSAGYKDLWRSLHPCDPGYTFGAEFNPMLHAVLPNFPCMRLDRILYKNTTEKTWSCDSVELFGHHRVQHYGVVVPEEGFVSPAGEKYDLYPSDHLGVKAVLRT